MNTHQGASYYQYAAIRAILREMHANPDRPTAKELSKARAKFAQQTQLSRNISGGHFKDIDY